MDGIERNGGSEMKKRPWRTKYKIWIVHRDEHDHLWKYVVKKPSRWEAREDAEAYCQERYPGHRIEEKENGHKWIVREREE